MNVNTVIEIFPNLSYPSDYSHVRRFADLGSQTAYFTNYSDKIRLENYKYTRIDDYQFTIVVGSSNPDSSNAIDISQAQQWGYVRVNNFFKANKWSYAFIDKVTYNNTGGVILHCTIDFYQSFTFDIEILKSFVERQHEPLYQANGLPVVNTIDEGLNYGLEYKTVYSSKVATSDIVYLVIVSTKALGDKGSALDSSQHIGTPTPLYYYVIPYLYNDDESLKITYSSSTEYTPNLYEIFKELQGNEEYVNSIVSLYTTVDCGIAFDSVYNSATKTINLDNSNQLFNSQGMFTEKIDVLSGTAVLIRVLEKRNFTTRTSLSIGKYRNVENYKESKLKMFPYTIIELTDMKGNNVEYKPEYINGSDCQVGQRGSLGTQNKVGYYLRNYLQTVVDSENHSLVDENPNNIPIVTEATADYIQGNANSIATKLALADSNAIVNGGSAVVNSLPMLFSPMTAPQGVANMATGVAQSINTRHNEIKTLEAKQADINNIPPNAKNMSGNVVYEWGSGYQFPQLQIKTVTDEYAKKLTDYFHMFGYQINELRIPSQHNRQHFNYIKCLNLNVRSGLNRDILNRYKAIFENGVTLWHTDDIGNYNLENGVI